MQHRFARPALIVALVAMAATATWLFASSASGGGKPTARKAQAAISCQLISPQPGHPLEMNSTEVRGVVKTVVMEKELFSCQVSGEIPVLRDVETFIEYISRGSANDVTSFARRVIITTCDKNFGTGVVSCTDTQPSLPTTSNPLQGCARYPDNTGWNPDDPVEMNTNPVANMASPGDPSQMIRTIKVEKDVLNCAAQPRDVYLFTEVLEQRTTSASGDSYKHVTNRYWGLFCNKNMQEGKITGCFRFNNNQ